MAQSALRALDQAYLMGIGQGPAPARVPRTRGQTTADMLGAAAIGTTPIPIVGDVVGVAADAAMYAADRKTRTLPNYAMSVLGMLPFVPGVAAVRAARGASPLEGTLDMSQAARMQTEYELAHEVAQRNAALPVEQGGLGLPPNNTAMDRAKAMGFDTLAYHGTGNDFDAFDPGMSEGARFNTGIFMTASPDVASTYALGEQRQVLPLMYRAENPINVYAEGANWNRIGPNTRVDLPARTVNQSEDADILRALGVEIEDTQEMLPRTTTLQQLFPEVYGYEDDFINTNDFSRWAKRQGADAVVFNDIVDRGPSGMFSNKKALMPARNIVSFAPSNIRSINAAFDPAKRNSTNLMAGAAGATIGLSALRNIQREEEPQPD